MKSQSQINHLPRNIVHDKVTLWTFSCQRLSCEIYEGVDDNRVLYGEKLLRYPFSILNVGINQGWAP